MRQWYNIDPARLCRKHLLGQHVEMHMAAGHLKRGRRLGKLYDEGWIDPGRIREYHDKSAGEMLRRGYRHDSPLDWIDGKPCGNQDAARHMAELTGRCRECKRRIEA